MGFALLGVSCREESPLNLQQRWARGSWQWVHGDSARGRLARPGYGTCEAVTQRAPAEDTAEGCN